MAAMNFMRRRLLRPAPDDFVEAGERVAEDAFQPVAAVEQGGEETLVPLQLAFGQRRSLDRVAGHSAIRGEFLKLAHLRHVAHHAENGLVLLDQRPQFVYARNPAVEHVRPAQQLLQLLQDPPGLLAEFAERRQFLQPGGENLPRGAQPVALVPGDVQEVEMRGRDRLSAIARGGLAQRHDGDAGFLRPAFGGVDHPGRASGEVALELHQVSVELFVGVDVAIGEILHFPKDSSLPDDPLPLLHFQREEPPQLRLPGAVHRYAGGVVAVAGEGEVLTDKDDRIAPHPLGQIERQVHDGRAGLHRCTLGQVIVEAAVGELVIQQDHPPARHRRRAAEGVDHVPGGFGLGDEHEIIRRSDPSKNCRDSSLKSSEVTKCGVIPLLNRVRTVVCAAMRTARSRRAES